MGGWVQDASYRCYDTVSAEGWAHLCALCQKASAPWHPPPDPTQPHRLPWQVTWPHNNALAAFVAARDIEPGEQLCISYVDSSMAHEPRRQALHFSYGFNCRCPKCREGQ